MRRKKPKRKRHQGEQQPASIMVIDPYTERRDGKTPEAPRHDKQSPTMQRIRRWLWAFWTFFWPERGQGWMVALTGLLVLGAYLQWRTSERTLTIANRAYVGIREAKIFKLDRNTDPMKVLGEQTEFGALIEGDWTSLQLSAQNSGETPALNLRVRTYTAIQRELPTDNPTYPDVLVTSVFRANEMSQGSLPKDAIIYLGDYRGLGPLTPGQIRGLANRELFLFIYGFIDYTDAFNKPHRTTYCWAYSPFTFVLVLCPRHNQMN
jgi:hypothetical protein